MNPLPPPDRPVPYEWTALYKRSLLKVADLGGLALRGLIDDALSQGQALRQRMESANTERTSASVARLRQLDEAIEELDTHASLLCDAYPATLLGMLDATSKQQEIGGEMPMVLPQDPGLTDDQLVRWRLALSEGKRQIERGASASTLQDLAGIMSHLRGYERPLGQANPVQPDALVGALVKVGAATRVSTESRLLWLQLMTPTLGERVRGMLGGLVAKLQQALAAVSGDASLSSGLSVSDMPPGGSQSAALSTDAVAASDDEATRAYLQSSVKALKRLLNGELQDWNPTVKSRASAAAVAESRLAALRSTPSHPLAPMADDRELTAFAYTVPAALEMLSNNPAHVGTVIERLAGRSSQPAALVRSGRSVQPVFEATRPSLPPMLEPHAPPPGPVADSRFFDSALLDPADLLELSADQLRDVLREHAKNPGQLLGLEVVSMIIENMCTELQLLPPVQRVIQSLECPLMRLVMADPRFFSDSQHPARQLLSTIAARSTRYTSEDDPAFQAFVRPMQEMVAELQGVPMESAEPFAVTLEALLGIWGELQEGDEQQLEAAQRALLQAERRNRLASTVRDLIRARPDAEGVPADVLDFATGPWAQVIAMAQIHADDRRDHGGSAHEPPQHWQAVLPDLFWSVHLDQARRDTQRLVRLIPSLLSRLRAGLKTIKYPPPATNQFLEALMVWHQKALMGNIDGLAPAPGGEPQPLLDTVLPTGSSSAVHRSQGLYLAPDEVQAIGFIDSQVFLDSTLPKDDSSTPPAHDAAPLFSSKGPLLMALPADANAAHLAIGDWVDVATERHHLRGQLVWASPEGTMFMFTASNGRNHAMTRQTLDKLISQGHVHLMRFDKLFDHAVDAVVQTVLGQSGTR